MKSIFLLHCFFVVFFTSTSSVQANHSLHKKKTKQKKIYIIYSIVKARAEKPESIQTDSLIMSNPTLLKMKNTSCTFIPRLFAADKKIMSFIYNQLKIMVRRVEMA